MTYTNKDTEGNWYIESKNGALTSDKFGRTYGPAIDKLAGYEHKEGIWKYYSSTMMECSVCKRHVPYHKYEFCPHCGSKMSKEH